MPLRRSSWPEADFRDNKMLADGRGHGMASSIMYRRFLELGAD